MIKIMKCIENNTHVFGTSWSSGKDTTGTSPLSSV